MGEKYKLIQKALINCEHALNRKLNQIDNHKVLLDGLANKLLLNKIPKRIEIYDNSHIQGSHPVGAMVVVGEDGFENKSYRKFNIRSEEIKPGDDYGMMKEVLNRRFSKIENKVAYENSPDLIIIDGGTGQLNIAKNILNESFL